MTLSCVGGVSSWSWAFTSRGQERASGPRGRVGPVGVWVPWVCPWSRGCVRGPVCVHACPAPPAVPRSVCGPCVQSVSEAFSPQAPPNPQAAPRAADCCPKAPCTATLCNPAPVTLGPWDPAALKAGPVPLSPAARRPGGRL